ncbi:GNAT family N-acetyltransferase [Bacillus sp. PDNC022]|uniref:GNAT family N-acetyltransferase n=1 Tax=Bacillus sp. PDNC022 TaxID=2812759 RepID=UPI001963CD21|nr:GNAT family N-acetyltransferase [Bacillus sp. PDNC022]QRY35695.1 GNAT family N-acetyltransferase [Bacillus sp. PDNC022]
MEIKFANLSDTSVIHDLMINAFIEYKDEMPPSSALKETVQSVLIALKDGERSLICYIDNQPVGMVRFKIKEDSLYFYRLSVIPEMQGHGIAKKLLSFLEDFAIQKELTTIFCKVRMTVTKNIKLYSSMGYYIYDEEVVHKPNGLSIKVVSMMKKLG